jgi:DNA adenine methylase
MVMFELDSKAKPILKWAGGKSGLMTQLLEHFPKKFDRYVEPFFGGGAVFFSLNPNIKSVINDRNRQLITLYEVVRDEPRLLMLELDRLAKQYDEEFYYRLRASKPKDKVAIAARLLFLNKTCFNGLYRENSKGEFNVPFGKRIKCPAFYDFANFLEVSKRLQNTQMCCGDFEAVLREAGKGDLVYCDPPYEPLNATSSFRSYTAEGFTLTDQERLRNCCIEAANRGAVILISNSTAPTIESMFNGHQLSKVMARRTINSKSSSRGKISELLIRINGDR